MKKLLVVAVIFCLVKSGIGQPLAYPYPVHFITLPLEGNFYKMAYMDVSAPKPNGQTVLLLHGKNFNGYYWKEVIAGLTQNGYRVIVPDQIGWGKSDKPFIHYSFALLANNTRMLLDTLHVSKVNVVGHSMGGMLATRFAVMYPDMISKLVLENPIGLEDYSLFVPYQTLDTLFAVEKKATYESMKKYQQSYYPEWRPAYDQYVQAQSDAAAIGNKDTNAMVSALTYQMILEQPTVYSLANIKCPTLLIIGQADRTVVGKNLLTDAQKQQHGQYPQLGRQAKALIPTSTLVELPGVGHIPHVQVFSRFMAPVLRFFQ